MKATLVELMDGMQLGLSNKIIEDAAKEFMKENGYKLTDAGKAIAISELESLAEINDYPADMIISLTTAIAVL